MSKKTRVRVVWHRERPSETCIGDYKICEVIKCTGRCFRVREIKLLFGIPLILLCLPIKHEEREERVQWEAR